MDDEKIGQEKTVPSYWAVLPSPIRYNPKLSSSAKVLYAELSSLTQSYGYCWADNDYFCRLYGITERTVIRLLGLLEETGCIRIEGGGTTKRRIFCGINPLADAAVDDQAPGRRGLKKATDKNVTATDKNVTATDKNVTAIYNTEMDQDNGTIPPQPPRGRREVRRENQTTAPAWKPERFEAFWRYYPAIPDGNGHGRRPAKARAVKAWDKLRPDDEEIAAMGRALKALKESRQWTEGIGIPYAATWINSRAWRDETEDLPTPAMRADRAAGEEAIEWV